MLIGLHGTKQTGKSTVARYLRDKHKFGALAIADQIYVGVGAAFSLTEQYVASDGNKDKPIEHLGGKTLRELAFAVETMGRQVVGNSVWMDLTALRIAVFMERQEPPYPSLVVEDIMSEDDAKWIRDNGGTVVHVCRITGGPDLHPNESGIMLQATDRELDNRTTIADLHDRIDTMLRQMERETPTGILLPGHLVSSATQ